MEGEATTAGTTGEAASREATSGSARASSALQTLLAELVVDCTLVLVAEDLVRLTELIVSDERVCVAPVTRPAILGRVCIGIIKRNCRMRSGSIATYLLELFLGEGTLVSGVLVGVPLQRLLAVRLLDVGLGGILADSKDLVILRVVHHGR